MEETTAPTGKDWPPPRLPYEIYRLIISQVNDFDRDSRKTTLVAVVYSCKLFYGIGEEYLYSQSPRYSDREGGEGFLHSLRLQPRRALYVRSLSHGYDDLPRLSMQCSNLQELKLHDTLTLSGDLEQACKNWGPTLQLLKVQSIEEVSDWIVQIMPHMTALTTLVLGQACRAVMEDVQAIADSKAPLRQITLSGLWCNQWEIVIDEPDDDEADEGTNNAIANMITAHSSTLRHLGIGFTEVGPLVLETCKKAKKLRTLDVQLAYSPSEAEVDDLLEACPDLADYTGMLELFSLREEWKTRPMIEEPETISDF
ncbi:uncharacterized protein B0J16DRAFT_345869 [Fusarium flagelliforme]|uniref:uncharacterized protein n=1 Tax=Fusarium flagelliforme TaxID=2675880 RepID=UPI001E8E4549|nr:uncharacterized protein B0J16DRAFT_345869 [Fusarium flagelliforme]KAH7183495.1 hypothetical protein B0J16DRAFT_345869 [Fusarium flagelliforme]